MIKKQNTLGLRLCTWVAAALIGTMASAASADVLYSQPTVDGANAILSNLNGGAQNADSFLLDGAINVDALRWWGSYTADAEPDNFIVRLFSDNSGVPGVLLEEYTGITVLNTDTGMMDSGGGEVFQYDYDLPDFVVSSGKYYVSVMNETLNSYWFWSFASFGGDGSSFYRGADGDSWEKSSSEDLAFQVIGTRQTQAVPEPESAALVVMAGACLLLARRRIRILTKKI